MHIIWLINLSTYRVGVVLLLFVVVFLLLFFVPN